MMVDYLIVVAGCLTAMAIKSYILKIRDRWRGRQVLFPGFERHRPFNKDDHW
jgi:hypothetical protein